MDQPADNSVWRNHIVCATRAKDWESAGGARGRTCEWLQPHSDHCSLPPRDWQQRKADRFWGRPCEQENIAGPGKQATEFALANFGKSINPITNRLPAASIPPFVFAEAELNLEQCRRAARPGFAFSFGDSFDIVDVRAGLREHVVQVVADADKREAFIEKLTDTRCTEKKKAKDDVVLAGFGDKFIR